jgi:hypothetical protein
MVLRKGMKCPKMIDLCLQPELLKHQKNGTRMYDGYENKAVYALIWKKLEPYLHEGGNVYFSPSGIIYQMNVEALKDSAGKMANEKYHLYRVSYYQGFVLSECGAEDEDRHALWRTDL